MSLTANDPVKGAITFDEVNFNAQENAFFLEHDGLIIRVPYILPVVNKYDVVDFSTYIFKNPLVSENTIFRVYEENESEIIGWLFSIQALLSREHAYAENEHFLSCAFVAFHKLLKGDEHLTKIPEFIEDKSLLDFYSDDDVILLICKKSPPNIVDIDPYRPCLFKYGYCESNVKDSSVLFVSKYFKDLDKSIKLYRISPALDAANLSQFLSRAFDRKDILHTFLSLYQIIEVLIFGILKIELKKCFEEYISLTDIDYKEFREVDDKLRDIKIEINRINILFKELSGAGELHELCNKLLSGIGQKVEPSPGGALYAVRCNLVHSYRLFSNVHLDQLKDVVDEFAGVLTEILMKHEP